MFGHTAHIALKLLRRRCGRYHLSHPVMELLRGVLDVPSVCDHPRHRLSCCPRFRVLRGGCRNPEPAAAVIGRVLGDVVGCHKEEASGGREALASHSLRYVSAGRLHPSTGLACSRIATLWLDLAWHA